MILYYNTKKLISPLIVHLILIILSALVIWRWSFLLERMYDTKELKAFLVFFPLIPYILFLFTIIMGWRSNNTGLIFISLVMVISYFSVNNVFGGYENYHYSIVPKTIAFLMPVNVLILSLIKKRPLLTKTGILYFILILIEFVIFYLLCYIIDKPESKLVFDLTKEFPAFSKNLLGITSTLHVFLTKNSFVKCVSISSLIAFTGTVLLLFLSYIKNRDVLQAGYLSVLLPAFLGIISSFPRPSLMIYFSAAGLILIISTIESSFSLAYIDELTGLPGRRSLSETLTNLGKHYTIAMIDIDYFKKFNDLYGHKTGDQVLKMIATKLSEISGGAKTFRYGGEEFTAIFPGKSAEEVKPHLEEYRQTIASTPFIVRSKERLKSSLENRGKAIFKGQNQAKVTVSIGIAEYNKNLTKPEKVLKAADKVLYKAKRAGRNRVKI